MGCFDCFSLSFISFLRDFVKIFKNTILRSDSIITQKKNQIL